MGVDETYPLHRYFARVKDVARLLGGVEATLAAVPARESDEAKNVELTDRAAGVQGRGAQLLLRAGVAARTGSR